MKKYILICGLFLLFLPSDAFSQIIDLDDTLTVKKIGLMVQYLEDPEQTLSFENVTSPENEKNWRLFSKESQGFGYTTSVFWCRLTVKNITKTSKTFYLQEDYPLMDSLKLYFPKKNGNYGSLETGDRKPFYERPVRERTFVFPLILKANEIKTYYLRFETQGSMNFVLKIAAPKYFHEQSFSEYILLFFFTGIVFIMIFYNLIIYIFSRDTLYILYVLFIADILFLTMILNGTLFQFILPSYPGLVNFMLPVILSFCVMISFLFAIRFLQMKLTAPSIYKLTKGCALISLTLFFIALLIPFRYSMPLITKFTIFSILYALSIGLILVLRKVRPAYFYLTAWVGFLIGALSYPAKSIGLLPTTFFSDWSLWIGTVMQVTLFSLGLADRINQMRKELKIFNLTLEKKVVERTEKLNLAVDELQVMNRQIETTKNQLWGEMQVAKKIQTVLLPKKPGIKGYDICAFMEPADEVGGDYYDVINLEGQDWLVIGDVSGHGVPAGLIMMMVQTAINVSVNSNPDIPPCELLTLINKTISANIKQMGEDKYMTITVLATHENGLFKFSGLHQDIMIYRAHKNQVDFVETKGIWIGIIDDIQGMLEDDHIQMAEGDIMLLFTDGITEAQLNEKHGASSESEEKMFGEKKLATILQNLGSSSVEEIKTGILDEMKAAYEWDDDITMVLIKRLK